MAAAAEKPKTELYRKAARLIAKYEKQGRQFTDLDIAVFNALGRGEWVEERINWLVLNQFDYLYRKSYPRKGIT
jgi:hypothetical protein